MRTTKELLVLLKKNLVWRMLFGGCEGICGVVFDLKRRGLISPSEAMTLYLYVYNHRPANSGLFFFPRGRIIPRYRFLTKLINELKEE